MAGRPRTPTHILQLRGAFKKDPQRRRPEEPKPDQPLGNPPGRLNPEVKKAWRDMARQCAPGVLTAMDRHAVELAAIALARVRNGSDKTDSEGRPLVTMTDLKSVLVMLGKFGMTPGDRRNVMIAK